MLKQINLTLDNMTDLLYITKALDHPQRLDILKILEKKSLSVTEIAQNVHIPLSTCSHHIDILQKSGLIITDTQQSTQGQLKLCSRNCDIVSIHIFEKPMPENACIVTSLPVGSYTDYHVVAPCGIAAPNMPIGNENEPDNFFHSSRHNAGLLWFTTGYLEYRISNKNIPRNFHSVEISFEACSEAPYYRNDWKSDITVWINDVELGTWTCPGDFGGRRGRLNPDWWPDSITQFGALCTWEVFPTHVLINGKPHYGVKLSDLNLCSHPYITLRIGVKEDAVNKGGINLFGANFGDHPQDIVFKVVGEAGK